MILRPKPVPSSRFTMTDDGTLVCEASDLGRQPFGQVYDDACDEGLTVVSSRTGREVVFAVEHVERDREGDLLWWDLIPADLTVRRYLPVTVRVFND